MDIPFAKSDRSTLGIEWELALIDRETLQLSPKADIALGGSRYTDEKAHPHVTQELLTNTVEVVSGPHKTVRGAVGDLRTVIDDVQGVLNEHGVDLMCAGSHPFGQWFEQDVTPSKKHYADLIERTQWWGRNMMIWGVHVHVGVESREKVFPIINALLTYLPIFQALSASSPFWSGENTGYASNRALMFQQLPTAGLPPQVLAWPNYEEIVSDLLKVEIIDDLGNVHWDIRPSPKIGTIEVRAFDGLSTFDEVGAIAALVQCLVEHLSTLIDEGEELPFMQPWFVRENKWRAARYGMDAHIILNTDGKQGPVRDAVERLLETLRPIAKRLDCAEEFAVLDRMLENGVGYQRQLRVAEENGGSLKAVVASLTSELRDGLK